jgi:hypothetical protein
MASWSAAHGFGFQLYAVQLASAGLPNAIEAPRAQAENEAPDLNAAQLLRPAPAAAVVAALGWAVRADRFGQRAALFEAYFFGSVHFEISPLA